uniref:Uncharacterized protein n=1 Tax=Mucochytrium quahogii TaxID=96639 RepID=A0A7S2W9Q9_9STRA|mmetsp:Transcript_39666/g.64346  ORF Transcript_39666/g.64346 Transcript_39666/m.64346 type:complete len:1035 (-) Transcript_39666:1305-4409(-)|eukprot:CAMPEP_0203744464 /NCGR_PEP_ID=MMETSP0098-20131031/516_1 /ASSEMBLY_ACC=CAM_ASM_000208 /TAXON_ID=96639 /ORGANISM=" , Strain NY0313808BC1" /LENGTH=1034 /DNA_ID=CAMNT_0050631979 /DNA_START=385 /DNA_END=3489 /DNA_ORIENTATION=+
MERGNRRFNLLALSHDEYLFESAAVVCIRTEEGSRDLDGRLWICTTCVVFEPKDYSYPVEKYKFRDMDECPGVQRLMNGKAIRIESKEVVEMKLNGKSHPYLAKKRRVERVFSLQHSSLDGTLKLVKELWDIRKQIQQEARPGRAALEAALLGSMYESRLNKPFDKSRLTDFREYLLTPKEIRVSLVSQLTSIPGCLILTDQRLYFQPAQLNNIGEVVQSYSLSRLCGLYKRRFLIRPRALEVRFLKEYSGSPSFRHNGNSSQGGFTSHDQISLLLYFDGGSHLRDVVYDILERYMLTSRKNCVSSVDKALFLQDVDDRLAHLQRAWQQRDLSNFEYLMHLNTLADRSVADLTQYPVFPWVITDYESGTLDLNDPAIYRDLSKPIGALNPDRLKGFKTRFDHMQQDPDPHSPPFLYGTHYTTPGYVLYFLVRKSPDLMLRLQNGQFDRPDRSFHTISATWNSVMNNTADLKELIPEFYDSDGEFLVNIQHLELGKKQDGAYVDDVVLPKWCSGPQDFVKKCRQALESDYVSAHLHEWIDLIFGFKQRGQAAIDSDNLFYYLTYEGAVDLDKVQDPNERKSIESQIYEFGQTPKQLFTTPHPSRNDDPVVLPPTPPLPDINVKPETHDALPVETDKPVDTTTVVAKVEDINLAEAVQRPATPPVKPPKHERLVSTVSPWWKGCAGDEIQTYATKFEVKAHRGAISDMSYNPVTNTLYSVSHDCSFSVVDVTTGTVVRRLAVGKLSLSCCELVGPGNTDLVIGSWDNSLYVYSLDFGRVVNRMVAHDDAVCCICCSSNSKVWATGSWESSLKIWSLSPSSKSFTGIASFYDHESEITCVDIDDSGSLVLSASASGDVMIHDLKTGEVLRSYEACKYRDTRAVNVHLVHAATTAIVCSEDGIVDVFDVSGGQDTPLSSVDTLLLSTSRVTCSTITPDGLCAVIGTSCGRVSLCNVNLLGTENSRNSSRVIYKPPSTASGKQQRVFRKKTSGKSSTFSEMMEPCISSLVCYEDGGDLALAVATVGGNIRILQASIENT